MSVYLSVCLSVLEASKIVEFGWNLAHLFLGWISGGVFFIFQKFWFLRPGDEFFTTATIGPPNSWKDTEVEPSALRTFDYSEDQDAWFLFSTSVELESDNVCLQLSVCLCMCMSQNFGAAWKLQKWFVLAEIWHICSLGEYLGVFFSFFKNFDFWGLGTSFSPKRG